MICGHKFGTLICNDEIGHTGVHSASAYWKGGASREEWPAVGPSERETIEANAVMVAEMNANQRATITAQAKEIKALEKRLQNAIELDPTEIQSGSSRVKHAAGLIKQLPRDHDGRNTWLMNYGDPADPEVQALRKRWEERAGRPGGWDEPSPDGEGDRG